MNSFLSFIKKYFTNAKSVLLREYSSETELEDAIIFKSLVNFLCRRNAQNAFIFTAFEFLIGVLSLFILSETGYESIGVTGSVVLILSAIVFAALYYGVLIPKPSDYRRMKLYNCIFWIVFFVGMTLISIYQLLSGVTVCHCIFCVLAFAVFPLMSFKESTVCASVFFVQFALFTVLSGGGMAEWITAIVMPAAYLWLTAVHYNSVAERLISDKRISNAEERCSKISEQDYLTGFLNKNGLSSKFSERYANGVQHKIAVILIDIDNFRVFNHLYGYDKSDNCLHNICNCIKIMAKPYTDIISRFGGDDFVIVLEDMEQVEVVRLAEQLREAVERMALTFGNGVVTISVGVSEIREYSDNDDTYSVLLNNADTQLMVAKKAGKNCVGFMNRPFINDSRITPVI